MQKEVTILNIESLNKLNLENVNQIRARVEGGHAPVVASKYIRTYIVDVFDIEERKSVELRPLDRESFSNIAEASEALQSQPIRKLLRDLNFSSRVSIDAEIFLTELKKAAKSGLNINDPQQMEAIRQTAGLSKQSIDNVEKELAYKSIHRDEGWFVR